MGLAGSALIGFDFFKIIYFSRKKSPEHFFGVFFIFCEVKFVATIMALLPTGQNNINQYEMKQSSIFSLDLDFSNLSDPTVPHVGSLDI
jgi:hypothetical protein